MKRNPYQKYCVWPRAKAQSFEAYGNKWESGMKLPDGRSVHFEFSGDGYIEFYVSQPNPLIQGGVGYSLSMRFVKIDDAKNIVEGIEFVLDGMRRAR